ncbi:MAG: NYN domain-containing protein [Nanoarchaeota archaeon]|nr:NYN domain-containing protein [Nanoarchaeota archaeon]MBU0977739.1 NYN domain-containing protein [Nanoarchaeota archaeon]
MTKKAIVFVDANNWYHNVKKFFRPGEISIKKISDLLCNALGFNLIGIRGYASIPDIRDGEEIYYEHMRFLSDLRKEGIKVITRKLQKISNKEIMDKKKEVIGSLDLCIKCKPIIEATFLDLTDISRKEKGIDVWIAIDMVRKSVVEAGCDVCILISGDTDFVPAVKLIKKAGKDVLSAFVPFGYSNELRNSTAYFIIRKETLIKCFRDYKNKKKIKSGQDYLTKRNANDKDD